MFAILAIFLTTVFVNSHEKYIDLLPEEEKQHFLDKIARRMMESVKNTEDKNTFKLTDDQFNEHGPFVQTILKEEAAHLRRRRADKENSEQETNTEEDSEIEPLNLDTNSSNDSDKADNYSANESTSLSINDINQRSYDKMHQDYTNADEVSQNSLSMQKGSLSTNSDKIETVTVEPLDVKFGIGEISTDNLQNSETLTVSVKMEMGQPENINLSTKFKNVTTKKTTYSTSIFTKSYDESTIKENDSNNTTFYTKSSTWTKIKDFIAESKPAYNNTNKESPVTALEYLDDNFITTPKLENPYSNTEASITVTPFKTDEGITDGLSKHVSLRFITKDGKEHLTSSTKDVELKTAATTNYQPISENQILKLELSTSIATSTKLPAQTPTNIEKKTAKKTKDIRKKKILKEFKNIRPVSYIADNDKKAKIEYGSPKEKRTTQKQHEVTTKKNTSLQPYNVYEIPWPDSSKNPPFLRSADSLTNRPFLVPAYKYSPNYGHLNSTNHLDPNPFEERRVAIKRDIRRLYERKYNKNKTPPPVKPVNSNNSELRKFGVYKKKAEIFEMEPPIVTTTLSPQEKEYEDAHTVTTPLISFPESHEGVHPMNSMKSLFKTIKGVLIKHKIHNSEAVKKHEYIRHLYGNENIFDKYGINNKANSEEEYYKLQSHFERSRIVDTKLQSHYKHSRDLDNKLQSRYERSRDINNISRTKLIKRKTKKHIKDLHNLQDQNSTSYKETSDVLIIHNAEDKSNITQVYGKRPKILTVGKKSEENVNLNTIAEILKVTDETDVFPTLEKLQAMNFRLMRRNYDVRISIYLKALNDLIEQDSKALKQYDWLATTVQVQSALAKLFQLIQSMKLSKPIHPADAEILKYVMFIHNFLLELKGANNLKSELRKKKLLPKNKNKKGNKILKEKGLINRVWLYLRMLLQDSNYDDRLNNLNEFLLDVEKALYDLHEAITNISKITKFKHQNWFYNLRQLYLTTNEKHLLEVLLHVSFARLIELIEYSCENGLEDNLITYLKAHKKEAKRTLKEMMFISEIIDEIKSTLE